MNIDTAAFVSYLMCTDLWTMLNLNSVFKKEFKSARFPKLMNMI